MASEQPFKKRRRYEQLMAEGGQPDGAPLAGAPAVPVKVELPSSSQVRGKEEDAPAIKVKQEKEKEEIKVKQEKEKEEIKVKQEKEKEEIKVMEKEEASEMRKKEVMAPAVQEKVAVAEVVAAREEVAGVNSAKELVVVDKEDEKVRKKRNREEIGNFYKAYRRVRLCLTRRDDPAAFGVKHDLEAAYHSMIELSQGKGF